MIEVLNNSMLLGQFSVEPMFGWLAVVPLALVMLASLWLTLSSTGLSLRARWLLVLLRFLAMLLLLVGWLRPALVTQRENQSAGAIAVLIDRSQSMGLASDVSDRSRWEVEREVWQAIVAATDLKIGQTLLVPYFYDGQLVAAPADELPQLDKTLSKPPTGRVTDLGNALAKIGQLQLDPPLRGVILLGDGTQTLIPAPIDPSIAARQMAQLDQPVLLVGIGPRGEKSQVKDVAIEGVPELFTAFVKKELKIPLVVNAQGVQGVPIGIELTLRASGKPDQIVGSREVVATKPSQKMPLEFTIVLPDEGEYLLEANARVAAREESMANNQTLSFVTVREGGVRILYLAG
ncbi:MAG: vWA domain-containing protein, partial [Pirellulaceae bacterium]